MTAVLVLGAWNNMLPLVVLLGIVLSAAGLAWLWSRYALNSVRYERLLSEQCSFPGEEVSLTVRVSNEKLLPLAWLEIDDELPVQLPAINLVTGELSEGALQNSISLLWYRRASWHYRLQCTRRGYYALGSANLSSGDIFGFYPRSTVWNEVNYLVVYPRIFSLAGLDLPLRQPLGEIRADHRIFRDPTRTIGLREYAPGDPFKYIHWKATARHRQLEVKIFEPSTTMQAILYLGVDSFTDSTEEDGVDGFEQGVSGVASIANYFINHGYPVGLFANTSPVGSDVPVKILPGVSQDHLINMLEVLARVTLSPAESLQALLDRERSSIPWGSMLIFVACRVSDVLSAALESLCDSGWQVVLVQVGQNAVMEVNHRYTAYRLRSSGDIASAETTLALERIS
ncbi:MAG: DUF58 domain-containing protein [Chloroflexota bacterium]|nr:DUF58 domain-containing protein [Chloroflexota bacterium]